MAHGKNRKANKPFEARGPQGRKEGPRRVVRRDEVERGDLGDNWFYCIERWELSTGATEYGFNVDEINNVGVRLNGRWKLYGQLDHARDSIRKLRGELRK